MPLDLSAPHVYAGPLGVSASGFDGDELTSYIHAARVLLGRRGASTAAAGLDSYALTVKTPSGATMKVVCASGLHRMYVAREGFDDTTPTYKARSEFPQPLSGVVAGGNLVERDCPLPKDSEHKEKLLTQFAANDATAKRIKRMIDAKRTLVNNMLADADRWDEWAGSLVSNALATEVANRMSLAAEDVNLWSETDRDLVRHGRISLTVVGREWWIARAVEP